MAAGRRPARTVGKRAPALLESRQHPARVTHGTTMGRTGRVGVGTHYLRYAASNLLVLAAGFVSFPVTTRLLDNHEFGVLAYFDTWALLLAGLLKLGAGEAMLRFYPHGGDAAAHARFGTHFVLLPAVLGLGAWGLLLFGMIVARIAGVEGVSDVMFLAMLTVPLTLCSSHVMWLMTVRERSDLSSATNVIWRWLEVGAVVVVIVFLLRSALGAYVGRLAAGIVVVAWLLKWLRDSTPFELRAFDRAYALEGLRYGLPMALNEVASVILGLIDRVMLKQILADYSPVGIYTIGFALASYLNVLLSTAISRAFTPAASRVFVSDGAAEVRALKRQVLRPLVYGSAAICTGLWLGGQDFILFVSGPSKVGSAPVFVFVGICFALYSILTVAGYGLLLEKRSRLVFALTAGCAVVNIGLNLVLIPRYGFMGAAWATGSSYLGLGLLLYAFCPAALRCAPEVSVLLRALVAALFCVALARFVGIDALGHPFARFVAAGVCVLLGYLVPVVATDALLRGQVRGWLSRSRATGAG